MDQKENKKRLLIIDANSIIHRAFHALPPLTTKKGEIINAIYGFLLVFFKVLKIFQPDYVFTCFDFPAPTFKHREFKEYKAHRPPTPRELVPQIIKLKEILKIFNVFVLEKKGYEADDLIGTICNKFSHDEKIIVSGDTDILQLVNEKTKVHLLKKGIKNTLLYDLQLVKKEYQGLNPEQLIDLKGLIGDSSDNIPGIFGIGKKTAINLLKEFGKIENLYYYLEKNKENTEKINIKLRDLLIKQKEKAFLSKNLAEIKKDVPIEIYLKQGKFGEYDKKEVIKTLKNLEFKSLIKNLEKFEKEKKIKRVKTKYKQQTLFSI